MIGGRTITGFAPGALTLAMFASLSACASPVSSVCTTPTCWQVSEKILRNLHPNYEDIDPCTRFNQYACGGFAKNWSEETADTLSIIAEANENILKSILESPFPRRADSTQQDEELFNMLVKNYNSCMDEESINAVGLAGMPEIVNRITELFPIDDADYTTNTTMREQDYDALASALAYLSSIGSPVFGEFWTLADPQNPKTMIPSFGYILYELAEHSLPSRASILDIAFASEDDVKETLALILPEGAATDAAAILAKGLYEFANLVAEAEQYPYPDLLSELYYSTTVAEAVALAPALVFDKVIAALAPPDYKLGRMVLQFPHLFANVSAIISETPKSTIQALLVFMAYGSLSPYLSASKNRQDRWEACYKYIDTSLPWIASKFFLGLAYSEEKQHVLEAMAAELKEALGHRVTTIDWISDETKARILEKISKMGLQVGYPQHMPDAWSTVDLAQYYSPIHITESLFGNVLGIRKWAVNRAWRTLGQAVDTTIWPEIGVHSYSVGARYNPSYNNIVLPAGMAQPPILYESSPSYVAYGSLGYVAGHEITHGIDTNGRDWDPDRQYNRKWWDEASIEEFENRTKCFVEQYSGMQIVNHNGEPVLREDGRPVHVRGSATLAENLADAGGLGAAWDAWKKHDKAYPSQLLPGLEKFTKEQLFFVTAGQMWCSKQSDEDLLMYAAKNSHAPPFARILGAAQNSRAFREAWECEDMEPVCELW